ncbi:alpha/beta fold hydrolase [Frankia sp. R82]|uniref:alpha/beta fold hydrolase n=1 Tax=Frankia sp. R82 TaxID=2950553 RepID=UPI002043DE02|nr:alpha/beta hydrolase [Frankia sp. R82]MCM3882169.1 alpha/beta hydrolase [Frankia sp. R82]
MAGAPTVVLVHGAFADASGFAGIITELTSDGYRVFAPANPLRTLSGDAASIRAYVSAIEGPVVLVGHSYGGAVISQAAASLDNVTALVFLAAFALEEGESLASVQEPFPPTLLGSNIAFTSYDAVGAPGGPDAYIAKDFHVTFSADLTEERSAVLEATQRHLSAAAYTEPAGSQGWKTIPSWYLISAEDNAISPETEQFMAKRAGATTETIVGSHAAFIAQPAKVAAFIKQALQA